MLCNLRGVYACMYCMDECVSAPQPYRQVVRNVYTPDWVRAADVLYIRCSSGYTVGDGGWVACVVIRGWLRGMDG